MRSARFASSVGVLAAVCLSWVPAGAMPNEGWAPRLPVVDSGANEFNPAADGVYVAWTANTFRRQGHYDVYFSLNGGPRQRVNPSGTQASAGGIDGTELVYTEFTRDGADLVLYELATETRLPTPFGVNTGRYEFNPTNSGDHLLFERDRFRRRAKVERVVLHDTSTDAETILATEERGHKFLGAGQVNGNWAVYFRCGTLVCDVFRYDIANDETVRVPNGDRKQQYAPSVSDTGVVYFVRSPPACGRNVRFMTWDGASAPTRFLDLPEGRDTRDIFFDDTSSSLYYERIRCWDFASDIYNEPAP
jgi:hypothetical protein